MNKMNKNILTNQSKELKSLKSSPSSCSSSCSSSSSSTSSSSSSSSLSSCSSSPIPTTESNKLIGYYLQSSSQEFNLNNFTTTYLFNNQQQQQQQQQHLHYQQPLLIQPTLITYQLIPQQQLISIPPLLYSSSFLIPATATTATTFDTMIPAAATGSLNPLFKQTFNSSSICHNNQQQAKTSTKSLKDLYSELGVYYNLVPWNQSFGMERVWMSEFRRIFSQYFNELWSIQPVNERPTTKSNINLHVFMDSAKVRFCCEKCSHSWTSMKGRVVFWFNLLQPNFKVGIVAIKLFGQRCNLCDNSNNNTNNNLFQQPMWYPEEVTKVLMNLYNRIGEIFYGFEKIKYEKQRRMGKPRTQHNKLLCQACHEGICIIRNNINENNNLIMNQSIDNDHNQNNQNNNNNDDDYDDDDKKSDDSGMMINDNDNDNDENNNVVVDNRINELNPETTTTS